MAQRPKRKFDSYQSPSSIPMPPATVAGSSKTYDTTPNITVDPTPELQKLYNDWRQLQELQEHLREQVEAAPGHNDQNDRLRPSAAAMSRSPSCASTSNSVTREINNLGLAEDSSPRTKRKSGRQGPLEGPDKARTALLRKLRACGVCHKRKVKCQHYDFSLFEHEYQTSKQTLSTPQPAARNPNMYAQQEALIGVGVGPNSNVLPSQLSYQANQGDEHIDLEAPLQQTLAQPVPISPSTTSPLWFLPRSLPNSQSPVVPLPTAASAASPSPFQSCPCPFSPLLSPYTTPGTSELPVTHVPIGREVTQENIASWEEGTTTTTTEGWECRYGDDGTASSHSNFSAVDENMPICKQRYGTLLALENHFQTEHVPFEHGMLYPRCGQCEMNYPDSWWDSNIACPQCYARGAIERWYFGDIIFGQKGTDGRDSGTSVRVDGGLARSQTITQLNQFWGNMAGMTAGSGGGDNQGSGSRSGAGAGSYQYGNVNAQLKQYPVINTSSLPPSGIPPAVEEQKLCSSRPGKAQDPPFSSPCNPYTKELFRTRNGSETRHKIPRSLQLISQSGCLGLFHLIHPHFLRLLVLSLVAVVSTQGWFSSAAAGAKPPSLSFPTVKGVNDVAAISVVCILVGILGMWLVRHVRLQRLPLMAANGEEMRSHRQHYQRGQRCLMRGLLSVPQSPEPVGVSEFVGGHGSMSNCDDGSDGRNRGGLLSPIAC